MKKTVLIFGSISGLIITTMMVFSSIECYTNPDYKPNDIVGYAGMIAAFAFIFIGIRNYRDKYNGGVISFAKAFKTGFYISLVASTIYVGVWLIDYYVFIPDYLDKFIPHVLRDAKADGATPAELKEKAAEMAKFKEMYKNPAFVIVVSYAEILPLGAIISLISAFFLRKKSNTEDNVVVTN
jgi:hypothetical protein